MDESMNRYVEEARQMRDHQDRREKRMREAAQYMKNAESNPNVQWLTINPVSYLRPMWDKPRALSREQHHFIEFSLRQMWAGTLLQNLRDNYHFSWSEIESRTGKSRVSWNNVTQCRYIPLSMKRDMRRREERTERGPVKLTKAQAKKMEELNKWRKQFKPVTDSFIHDVTTNLNRWARRRNISLDLYTRHFRNAVDKGLTVLFAKTNGGYHEDLILRIGDRPCNGGAKGPALKYHEGIWLEDVWWDNTDDFIFCNKDKDGKPMKRQYSFPLIDIGSELGVHNVFHWMAEFEEDSFHLDEKTNEPPKWCSAWYQMWEMTEDLVDVDWEGELLNAPEPDKLFDEAIPKVEVPKIDERTKQLANISLTPVQSVQAISDEGYLPQITLPFDVHPNWLDANGQGEVTFEVKITYSGGVKTGHAIKTIIANPPH